MSFDRYFTDRLGEIRLEYCRSDFVIGKDNSLIQLKKFFASSRFGNFLASPDDVDLDTITRLGLVGNTHLIDCSHEDPLRYVFDVYGVKSRIEANRNFQSRRVGDATWPALRKFGAGEYSRIKSAGRPDLVNVEYVLDGRRTAYRRLAIPLTRHQRQVTHLLVALLMQEVEVPLGTGE